MQKFTSLRNDPPAKKISYKTMLAVLLGNVFEFYCFILFIVLAPYISKAFFLNVNGDVAYIVAYSISFCGYIARPFGSMILGRYSDMYSRKKILYVSILITGIITFLIGIVPPYSWIGVNSVIALIALRFMQGFLVSGEEGGAAVYLSEVIDKKKKCLIGSLVLSSVFLGILLGRFVCNLLEIFITEEHMLDFGWRIPFVLALPLAIFICRLRKNVPEISWQSAKNMAQVLRPNPIKTLFANYKINIFKLIICCGAYSSITCLVMVYLPNDPAIRIPKMFFAFGIGFMMLLLPVFGYICDMFRPKSLLIVGLLSSAFTTIHCVNMIYAQSSLYQFLGMLMLYINTTLIAAPIFAFLVEMFPRHNRCTGVSFVFNTSVSIFSGAFPLLCSIIKNYNVSVLVPGYLISILAALGVIAVFASDRYREPLNINQLDLVIERPSHK